MKCITAAGTCAKCQRCLRLQFADDALQRGLLKKPVHSFLTCIFKTYQQIPFTLSAQPEDPWENNIVRRIGLLNAEARAFQAFVMPPLNDCSLEEREDLLSPTREKERAHS